MSARALNAILPQIASAPYEAHQKARTFASRYVKSGQYDTAIDVLFQSARELLKTGQAGSGVDLAGFLLDVYDQKEEPVADESRGRLTQLIALTGPAGSWRKTLIDKSLAWSVKHGECPAGDQDIHHYVGELLYKEGSFEAAEPHFLASGKRDSARSLAEMFVAWSAAGSVPGAFALRGTLPYLQNGNILAARTFITHFASAISKDQDAAPRISVGVKDEVILTKDPAVNWCQMAVLTCQRAQGDKSKVMKESWVRLCGTYQSQGGLLAAPEVRRVLHDIAELYFAIAPPKSHAANPLGNKTCIRANTVITRSEDYTRQIRHRVIFTIRNILTGVAVSAFQISLLSASPLHPLAADWQSTAVERQSSLLAASMQGP